MSSAPLPRTTGFYRGSERCDWTHVVTCAERSSSSRVMTAAVWLRTMETQGCLKEQAGLALLCSALSLSLCFNMVLFLRRFSRRGEVSCPRSRPAPSRGGAEEEPQEDGDSVYGNVGAESGSVDLGADIQGQPWRSQAAQKLSYASLDHRAMQMHLSGLQSQLHAPAPARHLLDTGVVLDHPWRETDSQRTIYLNRQQLLEGGAGHSHVWPRSSLTPQDSVTG
ncbi:uncharacterized protein LOC128748442 isoform X3 [Synchiropus splendidus]|uniref:uncharacterized protein LOC128748442 isoform X3 n=1 Tax=Synchiropus splendidus TaxID=270530 RepID=UPI00237E433D|nr:uncharacterized protein LOC128748442 isoform X3 [Synchiropus splendidus]